MKVKCFQIVYACAIALSFLAGGCVGVKPEAPEVFREASVEELVQLLEARASAIQTMKGLFRVHVKGPGLSFAQRVQAAVFFQRPQALRLQGFTPFGGELFEFVLQGNQYRLRIASTGRSFAGPIGELDRSRDISRPFRLSLLAMTGVVGIAPVPQNASVRVVEEGARYRLDVLASASKEGGAEPMVTRRIWFERRTLQVIEEDRYTPTGELDARMECEDFRPMTAAGEEGSAAASSPGSQNVLVRPFKITAEDGNGEGALVMTFQEMVPNPSLTPKELGSDLVGALL